MEKVFRKIHIRVNSSIKQSPLFEQFKLLTPAEAQTIKVIGDGQPVTMKKIAEKLNVAVSTPTTTVDRLVEKGYAERFEDIEDRRRVLVQLTEEGKSIWRELTDIRGKSIESIMDILTDGEKKALKDILQKLDAAL